MNILYGVCGEGFGHSSRAKEILTKLIADDHQVLVITYGQAYPVLKHFPILKVAGLTISFQENKLALGKTFVENIPMLLHNLRSWPSIMKRVSAFKPDVCITDMEPLVPIISHWARLPLISIDNQHRLTHLPLAIPPRYKKDHLFAKVFVHRMVAKADAFIILSFAKQKPTAKNAYIVSPILRNEVRAKRPRQGKHLLVYQTKPNTAVLNILENLPRTCIVYGYDKNLQRKNLIFRKTGPRLLDDLVHAEAVIATAGFTLMSEAMYLKKPYFALPLQGQFEQTLNALFLKKAGFGSYAEKPTLADLQNFLKNIPKFQRKLKAHTMDPDEAYRTLSRILEALVSDKAKSVALSGHIH